MRRKLWVDSGLDVVSTRYKRSTLQGKEEIIAVKGLYLLAYNTLTALFRTYRNKGPGKIKWIKDIWTCKGWRWGGKEHLSAISQGMVFLQKLVNVSHFCSTSNQVRNLMKPNSEDIEQSLQIQLKESVVLKILFKKAKLSNLIHC